MLELLALLTAIKQYAKDIHYNAKGDSFYGIHLLMDRIADNLDSFGDTIKEVCYMGAGSEPPASRDILKYAVAYIPVIGEDNKASLTLLDNLIIKALEKVEAIKDTDRADNSVLDSIAQDLKLKRGLVEHSL